jgi:hypothetical protein
MSLVHFLIDLLRHRTKIKADISLMERGTPHILPISRRIHITRASILVVVMQSPMWRNKPVLHPSRTTLVCQPVWGQ